MILVNKNHLNEQQTSFFANHMGRIHSKKGNTSKRSKNQEKKTEKLPEKPEELPKKDKHISEELPPKEELPPTSKELPPNPEELPGKQEEVPGKPEEVLQKIELPEKETTPSEVLFQISEEYLPKTENAPSEEEFLKKTDDLPKQNLEVLFAEAYYKFDPDREFGEGFEENLKKQIETLGEMHQKTLVVAETPNYTNYLGLYYVPNEEKYKRLKKWLEDNGCSDVRYEPSHRSLNLLAEKTLKIVVYFHPRVHQK
jgi:hypothetical protein